MDPLSITASAIAVATLAAGICDQFTSLRSLCKTVPGRLHALNNEVADFYLVCNRLEHLSKQRASLLPVDDSAQKHIDDILIDAQSKLSQLKQIVDRISSAFIKSRIPLSALRIWKKEHPRLEQLQSAIKTARASINIMLGAAQSCDMVRVRLDLEAITAITTQSAQEQSDLRNDFLKYISQRGDGVTESVLGMYRYVDSRIRTLEEASKTQALALQENETSQLAPLYTVSSRQTRRSKFPTVDHVSPNRPESIGVRVAGFAKTCSSGCRCACHAERKLATPSIVDNILGKLFFGFAGMPAFTPKCDLASCQKSESPRVTVEYWFPLGVFWSQIIRFRVGHFLRTGPGIHIDTLRRVPDSAQCVDFALDGNIEGLKDLFRRGLSSPRDVSSTRGYSVLRWAVYGKQWETCKFLVNAGADGDYRPVALSDNSPRNKAWDFMLQGFLSKEDEEMLRCLTSGSDWVDEQSFTLLHRIVTGLSLQKLEEAILLHPEDINAVDALGRTPLTWAAARGDLKAVALLLEQGAHPNTLDIQWTGPVSYAAERGNALCVRLLLEAGAKPDPIIPKGLKIGSPLNCAARNSPNSLSLRHLLDFGADTEASGVDGKTPLIQVARTNNAAFALLLLEHNADINATDVTGSTPLTTAITYNSHQVLQLLLNRWYEYSVCPRLRGPHLVEVAAKYGDAETLKILTATDHFRLKFDKTYSSIGFVDHVSSRFDADDQLVGIFQELVSIIQQDPMVEEKNERLLESGLLRYRDMDTDSEDAYVDALEDPA